MASTTTPTTTGGPNTGKLSPVLPDNFLQQPGPEMTVKRIDFARTKLSRYAGKYAVIIDNVLSKDECDLLLAAAEATTYGEWERAMVNVGGGRQMMIEDARNCGRIIWDTQAVASRVWERILGLPVVQEIVRIRNRPGVLGNGPTYRNETWVATRPNERLRFLKYQGGEYFRPHCDGSYETPNRKERSYFTLHLYLNTASPGSEQMRGLSEEERAEAAQSALKGGATTFHSLNEKHRLDVLPKAGRILLFQHKDLLHSGDDVEAGVKYTVRTDIMYAKE